MRNLALLRVLTAAIVMLCAQSGFAQPGDELKALRKDIEALKERHTTDLKEVQDIKNLMGLKPKDEKAQRPLAETRRGAPGGGLDDRQRAALVRALAAQPAGTPVWFAVYEQDPAARELGRALQAVFGEAGWVVRGMQGAAFTVNPGVFLFAADEQPPAYVQTAKEALELAGIPSRLATGYRSYYGEMQKKPGWRGFEMGPTQTYLVVIGPMAQGPLAESRRGATGGGLDDRQRAGLVRALAAQPAGTPVWFAVYEQDPAARELGRALQAAFGEAAWVVRGVKDVPFSIKSGVFLFAADEEPPAYVQTAQEALGLAGIRLTAATGYRSYYAQMRTKPGWQGFEMAPDQTYLVVIGPRPASQTAGSKAAPAPQSKSQFLPLALAAVALLTAAGGCAWYFFLRPRPAAEVKPEPEAPPTDPVIGPTAERH